MTQIATVEKILRGGRAEIYMEYIQMVDCVSPMTFFKYRQKSRMNSSVSSFMDISLR